MERDRVILIVNRTGSVALLFFVVFFFQLLFWKPILIDAHAKWRSISTFYPSILKLCIINKVQEFGIDAKGKQHHNKKKTINRKLSDWITDPKLSNPFLRAIKLASSLFGLPRRRTKKELVKTWRGSHVAETLTAIATRLMSKMQTGDIPVLHEREATMTWLGLAFSRLAFWQTG